MNILITGATGFLGNNIAQRLIALGHNVIGLGRNVIKGKLLTNNGIKFVRCSLNDIDIIEKHIKDVDYVIHSAALSSPWGKKKDFVDANIEGTKNIVNLALKYEIKRFIHISTPSLYFKFKDHLNIKETDSIKAPHPSMYTATKYFAEKIIDQAFNERNLPVITLRPRGIFGPGDETLLPRIIGLADKNKLSQIGNGENVVDITYVDNVSQAIVLALNAPEKFLGEKYNITNGSPVKLWPFLNELLEKLGKNTAKKNVSYKVVSKAAHLLEIFHKTFKLKSEPKITRYTAGLLYFSQTLSIEKAKRELKYFPEISMEKATEKVITWWNNNES